MKIQNINTSWKNQNAIDDDMCNYAIQISKPTGKIGFYENVTLKDKYLNIETAVQKATEVQNVLKAIDSYIQVSVVEGLI